MFDCGWVWRLGLPTICFYITKLEKRLLDLMSEEIIPSLQNLSFPFGLLTL